MSEYEDKPKRAKRRLKNMNFSSENAHMALVSVENGGGANGVNTLVMKAAEDTGLMNEKQIESLKEIIKSVAKVSDEEADQVIGNVISKDADGGDTPSDPVSDVEKASNEVTPDKGDNKMSDTQVDVQAEIQKALEAQKAEVEKAVKAQYEEIEKGLKAEIEAFKAKEAEVQKAQFVEVAKGYQALGVDEESVEGFAVALMKMKGDETFEPVMKALEKGLNIAKAAAEGAFEVQGHDVEAQADEISKTAQLIKAKYDNK